MQPRVRGRIQSNPPSQKNPLLKPKILRRRMGVEPASETTSGIFHLYALAVTEDQEDTGRTKSTGWFLAKKKLTKMC